MTDVRHDMTNIIWLYYNSNIDNGFDTRNNCEIFSAVIYAPSSQFQIFIFNDVMDSQAAETGHTRHD